MDKRDSTDITKISKKAQLAITKPGAKRKKRRKKLIYEYFICSLALVGTILAIIDIFRGKPFEKLIPSVRY